MVGKVYPLIGTLRDPTKIGVTIWKKREESDNSGFALDGSDAAGYEMICTWQF
jgi:hypothetical protein